MNNNIFSILIKLKHVCNKQPYYRSCPEISAESLFTLSINRITFFFRALHYLQDFGKCERLHGHDYYLEAQLQGLKNKENQAVMDFQIIKQDLMKLIKTYDKKILLAENASNQVIRKQENKISVTTPKKSYLFPLDSCTILPLKATTVEELCEYFYLRTKELYPTFALKIILYETKGNQVSFGDF